MSAMFVLEELNIRLLCDFDDKLFMGSHDPLVDDVDEDERLENLNIDHELRS